MITIRHPFRLAAVLVALLLVGCEVSDTLKSRSGLDGPGAGFFTPNFGDAYEVVLEATAFTAPPRLGPERLELYVRYSGGCAPHDFHLHARRDGATAELWLRHDAHGDSCEASLTEQLAVPADGSLATAEEVFLLLPDGTSFRLR